jgi:hypothetical protein
VQWLVVGLIYPEFEIHVIQLVATIGLNTHILGSMSLMKENLDLSSMIFKI